MITTSHPRGTFAPVKILTASKFLIFFSNGLPAEDSPITLKFIAFLELFLEFNSVKSLKFIA